MSIYSIRDKKPQFPQSGNYWIAPNATIIGNCILGENASIWFNAVLRGDNEPIIVGANSNIQDGCVLHTDMGAPLIIGQNVTIGHKAMLHGCEIDENCLIGIGAIILNHAKIGKNCIIGANSLVTEGKIIPDNSLIMGSPAKVIRQTTPEQIQMMKASALHYVDYWKAYKAELKEL